MTRRLVTELQNNHQAQYAGCAKALDYVWKASTTHAIAHGSLRESTQSDPVDIEQLFSAVQLLAERQTLEVAPFIEAWKPEVEQLDRRTAGWPSFLGSNLIEAIGKGDASKAERLLREAIQAEIGKGTGKVYRTLLDHMTMALRRVVHIDSPEKVDYLRPIVELARRRRTLIVATLNYDRSIELACRSAELPCSTSISSWSESGRLTTPETGVYLLKLHGSIDWYLDDSNRSGRQSGGLPQTTVGESEDPVTDRRQPAVVFGQRGKLRPQGPFLELLAEFDRALRATEDLLVVGYSFRDEHVNELIRTWVNGHSRRHLTVVDPGFPEGGGAYSEDFRRELLRYLIPPDRPMQNQPTFDPRLTVHRENAETALSTVLERFT